MNDQIDILVDRFADLVGRRSAALKRADSDEANRCARKSVAAFRELTAFGDVGRDALARLFSHPLVSVRLAAAAWLLRHKHDEAIRVLRDIAQGDDFNAFRAQECIKRWQEGSWQLDPVPSNGGPTTAAPPSEPPR
ncbi:MAG: DUF2019 domain-containing protein [Pirellulales bacterium]